MDDKKALIRQFILILVVGLAVSFFSGEYSWSYTIEPSGGTDLEDVLRYLNQGLPILALVIGAGVVFYLAAKGKLEKGRSEPDIEDRNREIEESRQYGGNENDS